MSIKEIIEEKPLHELYKSLDNFKSTILTLKDIKDSKILFDRIEQFWKKEIGFFIFIIKPTELKTTSAFYRIRIDENNINPHLIQEFGVPPVSISNNYQRANIPKHPVFYSSLSMDVAIFESLHKPEYKNKNFYLSKWILNKDMNILTTQYLFKDSIKSDLKNNSIQIQDATTNLFKGLNNDQKEFVDKYIEFIVNEFLNENSYALSCYIGHKQLYAEHSMISSILFYPSIKKQHNGINAAMNPNFSNQNLRLEKIYHCKVTDNTFEEIKVAFLNIGILKENQIIWRNISDDDMIEINKEYSL